MLEKKPICDLSAKDRLLGAHLIYQAFYPSYSFTSLDEKSFAQLNSGYLGLDDTYLEHSFLTSTMVIPQACM